MTNLFDALTVGAAAKRLLGTHNRTVDSLLAALHAKAERHSAEIADCDSVVSFQVWLTSPPRLSDALHVSAVNAPPETITAVETYEEHDRKALALCERLTTHPDVAERVLGWSPGRVKEEIEKRRGYLACAY